jgi:hypothetical protein
MPLDVTTFLICHILIPLPTSCLPQLSQAAAPRYLSSEIGNANGIAHLRG